MKYTTLSSLKKKLWIATGNTESDSELSLIIDQATQLIDNELWKNLEKQNIQERTDGTGTTRIYLSRIPSSVISVTGSYWNYTVDFIDSYILHLKEKSTKWRKNIIVEYEYGFDTVPSDIESICLDICVVLCDQRNISWTNSLKLIDKNIQTQKLGNLSITYFWEKEKKQNAFEKLDPGAHIETVFKKYKPFIWLYG